MLVKNNMLILGMCEDFMIIALKLDFIWFFLCRNNIENWLVHMTFILCNSRRGQVKTFLVTFLCDFGPCFRCPNGRIWLGRPWHKTFTPFPYPKPPLTQNLNFGAYDTCARIASNVTWTSQFSMLFLHTQKKNI